MKKKWLIVCISFGLLLIICFGILSVSRLMEGNAGEDSRSIIYKKAEAEFLASRQSEKNPKTYDFITKDILFKMDEKRVNEIMISADEKIINMQSEPSEWDGYINIYIYNYGPHWQDPIIHEACYLLTERFTVFFDRDGRAVKIMRLLIDTGQGKYTSSASIDLDKKSIKGF